jgi:topoisomerase-4 subunit B
MSYDASHIEVLEGLEAVRRRPGMYIGGIDSRALHHLFAEILDNAMDEAVAGHADRIDVCLEKSGALRVVDNGRGIPIDPHPRYPDRSALEVVMTMLHSGGKFNNHVYATSGGLHGVGVSVVNALSEYTDVTVARNGFQWHQRFSRGNAVAPLEKGQAVRGNGTTIAFLPDSTIFGDRTFKPERIVEMCRAKAYLNRGVVIGVHLEERDERHEFHYPNGLQDYLQDITAGQEWVVERPFTASIDGFQEGTGKIEWSLAWTNTEETRIFSFCNTVPTPNGGTHETGLRAALARGVREYAQTRNLIPRGIVLAIEDVLAGVTAALSVFIHEPQFSGQTKDKLTNAGLARHVDAAIKDRLDQWLHVQPEQADRLAESVIERARERINRRKSLSSVKRKSATSRLTLPGKLTDCTATDPALSELFIVEGDSAGGSAKQARDRKTQAVLPLRGKILNVEQATQEKFNKNIEIQNLVTAVGTGWGEHFDLSGLRYGRVIIMTDADVDGAHIASLLLTFFFRFMRPLVTEGHLFLAQPPLYKITRGAESQYALDDAERERIMARMSKKIQKCQHHDLALQGTGRNASHATAGNHHESDVAPSAAGVCGRSHRHR